MQRIVRVICLPVALFFFAGQLSACPDNFSTKKVFGIHVCAGQGVDEAHLSHAAKILKLQLDFNGDGIADNPKVVKKLIELNGAFVVFKRERQLDDYWNAMRPLNPFQI